MTIDRRASAQERRGAILPRAVGSVGTRRRPIPERGRVQSASPVVSALSAACEYRYRVRGRPRKAANLSIPRPTPQAPFRGPGVGAPGASRSLLKRQKVLQDGNRNPVAPIRSAHQPCQTKECSRAPPKGRIEEMWRPPHLIPALPGPRLRTRTGQGGYQNPPVIHPAVRSAQRIPYASMDAAAAPQQIARRQAPVPE